jgi:uronate dehydrogenase
VAALDIATETWVLTGAAGRIARTLRGELSEVVGRLRLTDLLPVAAEHPGEEAGPATDLRDPAAVRAAIAGARGVLHLGGLAAEADFRDIDAVNIAGTYHVLEAARRAGCRRVVFASSAHATGGYPVGAPLAPDTPVRPDSLYGVSKAAGEALGRMFSDKFGLSVVCLRIGSFQPSPRDAWELSTWLSPGDCLAALLAAMRAPDVPFAIFYAVSRNTRRWWDLDAGAALGYEPRDDAEAYAELIADQTFPEGSLQGAEFTDPDFTLTCQR